jgi:hypothetical protein
MIIYALNFFAFGTFSPLNNRSAPTFLPLLGQPLLGGKSLFQTLQEESMHSMKRNKKREKSVRAFIGYNDL